VLERNVVEGRDVSAAPRAGQRGRELPVTPGQHDGRRKDRVLDRAGRWIEQVLVPRDHEHIRRRQTRRRVAPERRPEVRGGNVDGPDASRHVDVEREQIARLALPRQRRIARFDRQPRKVGDRTGRLMLTG